MIDLRATASRRAESVLLAAAAVALLALRVPFLPPTLGDADSINFDLGVHDYDPVAHQPHPPGYPVYIFLAKLAHPLFPSRHAAGLGFISAVTSALTVVPLYFLMRQFGSPVLAALTCVLTLFNPVVWFNSVRPMSDLAGLFMVVAAQCLLVRALNGTQAVGWLAGLLAGLAVGVRLQAVFLVLPIALYVCVRRRNIAVRVALSFGVGVLAWLIPAARESGGFAHLVQSFAVLVDEALPVEPLVSQFTIHRAAYGVVDILLRPWRSLSFGAAVLLLAVVGAARLTLADRRSLALALLLFVPYAAYHYLLQLSDVLRYSIPIVPLVAFLASASVASGRRRFVVAPGIAIGVIVIASVQTLPALRAYHGTPSPSFQAIARVQEYALHENVVVTGNLAFARHLSLLRKQMRVLPPVRGREWQVLAEYWKQGGRAPILFFRVPTRTMLLLAGRDTQRSLGRWNLPSATDPFLTGLVPGNVELVRLDPPRWFCDSGFFVSLDAGPAELVKRQPHRLYVRPTNRRRALIVSGSVDGPGPVTLALRVGEEAHGEWTLGGSFTVRTMLEPPRERTQYVPVQLEASAPVMFTDVWLEPEPGAAIRPARGFYYPERDAQARLFRWIAPQARAVVYLSSRTARLRLSGWIPLKYFRRPVTISLAWNGRALASFTANSETFRFERTVERTSNEPWGELTISSSHSFVPDTVVHNGDRRTLAFRVYELRLDSTGG